MSKSFPEWWKHGQKVRTANDGVLTLNIAEDSEYWLTNNAGKEVSVFSMDILGPASVPEACSMTTDITELAQREKFEAWFKSSFHPDKTGPYIKDQLYFAWKAAGAELVQALEKAQAAERRWHRVASRIHEQACESDVKIDELEAIRAAAEKLVRCKGRYHSEQNYRALAALFGVNTPDLPPLDGESRTVKLPDFRHERFNSDWGEHDAEAYQVALREELTAAGIKVEAE